MYELIDKQVCHDCIKEKYLSHYILRNGNKGTCNYCNENTKVLSLCKIKEIIVNGFEFLYKRTSKEEIAENAIHIISPHGFSVYINCFDLLKKYNISYNAELLEDFTKIIETEWWHDNKNKLNSGEKRYYTWKIFSLIVKHETRYNFSQPYTILEDTLKLFEKFGIYKTLSEDLIIYRARKTCIDCDANWTSKKLGSPPDKDCLQQNRFSPAGISMFYGSEDKDTCVKEIDNPKAAVIGKWTLPKGSRILDLTKHFEFNENKYTYPNIPSIFDKTNRDNIHTFEYILDFATDLSKPIDSDTNSYDYVPTQVVAEYFKLNKPDVLGICTYSSKNNGKNYTLFLDNDDCEKEEKIKLQTYFKHENK